MSAELQNGLHTELPSAAQDHIDQLHPELQQTMGEHLLRLSHADFHQNDLESVIFGEGSAGVEIGAEHQPQIDRVQHYMTEASVALHAAHDSLTGAGQTEEAISPEGLAATAHRQLIEQATHHKESGDTQAAIANLETALVIQSLVPPTPDTDSGQQFVRGVVRENLATELVEATSKTFGLVSVRDRFGHVEVTPATHCSNESRQLLQVASSVDFSDDFSETAPFVDQKHAKETAGLSQDDLLCLSDAALARHDTEEAKGFVGKALDEAEHRTKDPDALVTLLTRAEEFKLGQLDDRLSDMRTERLSLVVSVKDSASIEAMNQAIPRLVVAGHTELAQGLMSSRSTDARKCEDAAYSWLGTIEEADRVSDAIRELHEQKQQALTVTLQAHGAPDEAIREMLHQSTIGDPDQAASVSPDFWPRYEKLDQEARVTLIAGDGTMEARASALMALDGRSFGEGTMQVVSALTQLQSPEDQERFIGSVQTAWGELDNLPAKDKPEKEYIAQARKLSLLQYDDPAQAFEAARQVFGEKYLEHLHTLRGVLQNKEDNPLMVIYPEAVEQLVHLKDQLGDELFMKAIEQAPYSQPSAPERIQNLVQAAERADGLLDNASNRDMLLRVTDPFKQAEELVGIKDKLEGYGLKMHEIQALDLMPVGAQLDRLEGKELEEYIRQLRFEAELSAVLKKSWTAWLSLRDDKEADEDDPRHKEALKPDLARLKVLDGHLSSLGLGRSRAYRMFDSWNTYDAFDSETFDKKGEARELAMAEHIKEQVEVLMTEMRALSNFVEMYGPQDTTAIVDTFGIHHFSRYSTQRHNKPGEYKSPYNAHRLHEQLIEWRKGEVSPKNVLIGAHSDHSNALESTPRGLTEQLGIKTEYKNEHGEGTGYAGEGLFFFEAGSKADIAKIAISIGQRERQNGRDPRHGRLENFIIEAHGSPKRITLGPYEGQVLTVEDYVTARQGRYRLNQDAYPRTRVQANTFSQWLGDDFRIILYSCSAGAPEGVGQGMSAGHDKHLAGAAETVSRLIIEPDGDTIFKNGEEVLPTIQYDRGLEVKPAEPSPEL